MENIYFSIAMTCFEYVQMTTKIKWHCKNQCQQIIFIIITTNIYRDHSTIKLGNSMLMAETKFTAS